MNFDKITHTRRKSSVAIIGGGPAGLMAAEVLSLADVKVNLYDAMPSVGRKFLMAGKGGMNITHAEDFDVFLSRYGNRRPAIEPILTDFTPSNVRQWLQALGISSFVGSSGRVFPDDMKAAPLLRRWLQRLRGAGVGFHVRHQWTGWRDDTNLLCFATPQGLIEVEADAVILALGGGSWPKLGSTGAWLPLLQAQGITVAPLKPANCGFDCQWSEYFQERFAGHAIKSVGLDFTDLKSVAFAKRGEIMVTQQGLEGGLLYTASAALRDIIADQGYATIRLDLAPDRSLAWLTNALSLPRGKLSLANMLRKRAGIEGVKAALLREALNPDDFAAPNKLAANIKALPIKLLAARPLAEAISTAGGVTFEALDGRLMSTVKPGLFCAGEMLDWEAPTGGYLLSFCLASGRAAGLGALAWLQQCPHG